MRVNGWETLVGFLCAAVVVSIILLTTTIVRCIREDLRKR